MDQPKPVIAHCSLGCSSPSSSAALKEAVRDLEIRLSSIREVNRRAGWNGWIKRDDEEVWSWLKSVERLEEEIRDELDKLQPKIAKAVKDPFLGVKVLHSIPCIKRNLQLHDHRILLKIKELSGKIESGFKDDDVNKFDDLSYPDPGSADRHKPPLTTSDLRVLPVRGQISEKDDLLNKHFFPTSDKANKFVKIYGYDGSGKTTLAQMVFNDERVGDHFEIRRWVCVANSLDKSINRVRRELRESKEDVKSDCIANNILSGKKFLLVLDDVHDWGVAEIGLDFCSLLLKNNGASGSIILITTRNSDLYPRVYGVHAVRELTTSDCWSLLKRVALSGKPQLHKKIIEVCRNVNIGRKFAGMCEGSPLAAKILGDYLKSKATVKDWEDALGDNTWQKKNLRRIRDRGFFLEYDKLSVNLKRCLSYCAVYPEGACINVEILVALWAAMRIVGTDTNTCIDELATRRSWLYNTQFSIYKDKITSCNITTLYHAGAQHACPEFTMAGQLEKLDSEAQSLRCFIVASHCTLPKDLFKRLKYVKALVLSSCNLEQLPDEVGSLAGLKFLDLSGNPLKLLPETIHELIFLESLYLHSCYLLFSLPNKIECLKYLRHLRINHTTNELHNLPQGFEKLTSIRTLDVFRVGGTYDNIGKLRDLNHLVDIRIAVHGKVCFSDADLKSKSELENLELCFVGKGRDQEMTPCVEKLVLPPNLEMLLIQDYHGLKLPLDESTIIISNLKRLSLRSNINIDSLPALWKLSSLEFLWLYDMPNIQHLGCEFFGLPKKYQQYNFRSRERSDPKYYSSDEDADNATNQEITEEGSETAFLRLKTLRIQYLKNWEIWEDADEFYEKQINVMPCLVNLTISNCPKLKIWPLRILRDTPEFKETRQYLTGLHRTDKMLGVDVGGKHGSDVQKLKDLNDRDGYIRIAIHGHVNFGDADLKKKYGMKYLELCFHGFDGGRDKKIAQCIEDLEPPQNLEMLKIQDYPRSELPKWILSDSISNKLTRLSILSCPSIAIGSFPSLWKLSCLKSLWLFDLPCIEHLGREFFGYPNSADGNGWECTDSKVNADGVKAFPRLEILRIEYLENWETWEDVDEADVKRIEVMPSLKKLIIADCPKFKGAPVELRILKNTPWYLDQQRDYFKNEIEDYLDCILYDTVIEDDTLCKKEANETNTIEPPSQKKCASPSDDKNEGIYAELEAYMKLKKFVHDAYISKLPAKPLEVSIPEGVLGKTRVTAYLPLDSLREWFENDHWLSAEQLCIWSKILYEHMTPSDKERVQMANSALITTVGQQGQSCMRAENLVNFMMENRATLYLVPFLRPGHWELLVIVPGAGEIYRFDSLQRNICRDQETFLKMVAEKYAGRSIVWDVEDIKHKRQVDSWECGYYVMIWMQKIALEIQDLNLKSHFPMDNSPYEPDKLKELDWKWCAHVVQFMPESPS